MSDWSEIAVQFGKEDIDTTSVVQWAKELAYQGLDPTMILKYLSEKGGDNWKQDAKYIIVFALTRGNKIMKAMGKMSPEGKKKMGSLLQKYNLKENATDREAITPVRVAQCLPSWTCAAASALQEYLPVGPSQMNERSSGYPGEMMCMAFGSMIPNDGIKEETRKFLIDGYSLWQDAFTRVINPKMKGEGRETVRDTFKDPLSAAVGSQFFPNEARFAWLKAKALITPSGDASDAVKRAANAYRNM